MQVRNLEPVEVISSSKSRFRPARQVRSDELEMLLKSSKDLVNTRAAPFSGIANCQVRPAEPFSCFSHCWGPTAPIDTSKPAARRPSVKRIYLVLKQELSVVSESEELHVPKQNPGAKIKEKKIGTIPPSSDMDRPYWQQSD